MGVKRGRGRTCSPPQSRTSLLVKRGGESFSNHKIWVAERGEKVGVWHGTLVFGVQTKKGGGILKQLHPSPPLLDVKGKGGFFPPSLSLLAGFWWYEPQSRSMGPR